MDTKIFSQNIAKLNNQNTFLRMMIGASFIVIVLLAGLLFKKQTAVVIVPPNITKSFKVSESAADPEYFQETALFLATMIGNLDENTSEFVLKYLREHMTPDLKSTIRQSLENQIYEIRQNNMATTFAVSKLSVENANSVSVIGVRKTYINDDLVEATNVKYTFSFSINNYNIYIVDFAAVHVADDGSDKEARKRLL